MNIPFFAFILISFFGGLLALLSPCSGALLPTFFAYAFKTRKRIFYSTVIFFLGLSLTAVPLGMGIAFVAGTLLEYGEVIFKLIGALFLVLGFFTFVGKPLAIHNEMRTGKTKASVFLLGAFSGLSVGTCSGPILGAIATLAGLSNSFFQSFVLMIFYTLGMITPLLILSIFIKKLEFIRRFLSNETLLNRISGLLFILLGVIFIYYRGSFGAIPEVAGSSLLETFFDAQESLLLFFNSN